MDPQRFKDAYGKLQALDERLGHRVRPRGGGSMLRPSADRLEENLRDLAAYTVELKEVVEELMLSLSSKPRPPSP